MKHFKPAFLGRTTLVPYFPLPADIIRRIVTMQLDRIGQRVQQNYRAAFQLRRRRWWTSSPSAAPRAASGARNVENILSRTLLPELSARNT